MRRVYPIIIILGISIASFYLANAAGYKISVSIPGVPALQAGKEIADPAAYMKGIYNFALGAAGLLALGMIVFGAIEYTISAGNVTRQSDAKDRITQAIYGLVLLLGAVLILNTIRPEITKLKLEKPVVPAGLLKPQTSPWASAVERLKASMAVADNKEQERIQEKGILDEAQKKFEALESKPANDPERLQAELNLAQAKVDYQKAHVDQLIAGLDVIKNARDSLKVNCESSKYSWPSGYDNCLSNFSRACCNTLMQKVNQKGLAGGTISSAESCWNSWCSNALSVNDHEGKISTAQIQLKTYETELQKARSAAQAQATATTTPAATTPP